MLDGRGWIGGVLYTSNERVSLQQSNTPILFGLPVKDSQGSGLPVFLGGHHSLSYFSLTECLTTTVIQPYPMTLRRESMKRLGIEPRLVT